MPKLLNQYDELVLAAVTSTDGIVEVGAYEDGAFWCYTSDQEPLLFMPHELAPINLHTEHYIATSVIGENAWWLTTNVQFDEITDLVWRLTNLDLPVPVDIHQMTQAQLIKISDMLLLAEQAQGPVENPFLKKG